MAAKDAVIYHPAVTQYLRFVATTVGRDKTLRTIQYLARFLEWYTYRTNYPTSTVDRFKALKSNFGTIRKNLRLGKFVEHFKAAAVASDAKSLDPIVRYLTVGRQLGYAFYTLLDNITYVDSVGVYKWQQAKDVQRRAWQAWFVGIVCNVAAGVYKLYSLRVAEKKERDSTDAEKAVELKKLRKDRVDVQLQLFCDLCDLTVPATQLGYAKIDDGLVGLLGTVSSILGLQQAWAKAA